MPSIMAKAASKLSFSHLTGASKKSEDKDDDKNAAQEEKDQEEQDREDGDARRAADDKDDEQCAEDESDGDKDDKKDGKRSKKAEDEDDEASEDDDEEEMRGKSAISSARRRERARCAAIFASPAAARNIQLACKLAFATSLPRKEAIAVLEGTPATAKGNADRQSRNPNIGPGGTLSVNSAKAIEQRWDSHFKSARRK